MLDYPFLLHPENCFVELLATINRISGCIRDLKDVGDIFLGNDAIQKCLYVSHSQWKVEWRSEGTHLRERDKLLQAGSNILESSKP